MDKCIPFGANTLGVGQVDSLQQMGKVVSKIAADPTMRYLVGKKTKYPQHTTALNIQQGIFFLLIKQGLTANQALAVLSRIQQNKSDYQRFVHALFGKTSDRKYLSDQLPVNVILPRSTRKLLGDKVLRQMARKGGGLPITDRRMKNFRQLADKTLVMKKNTPVNVLLKPSAGQGGPLLAGSTLKPHLRALLGDIDLPNDLGAHESIDGISVQEPGGDFVIPANIEKFLYQDAAQYALISPVSSSNKPTYQKLTSAQSPTRTFNFSAYPSIRIQERAEKPPSRTVFFDIGFDAVKDELATVSGKINLHDVTDDDKLLVITGVEGGKVLNDKNYAELGLRMDATATFGVEVDRNREQITIKAQYFYQTDLVGCIVKNFKIEERGQDSVNVYEIREDEQPHLFPVRNTVTNARYNAIDIVLIIQKGKGNTFNWNAITYPGQTTFGPWEVEIEDVKAFAQKITNIQDFNSGVNENRALRDELESIGRDIAALVPGAILDRVLMPAFNTNKTHSILLLTDDPYIPWELATFGPGQVGRANQRSHGFFMAELAAIGRWALDAENTGTSTKLTIDVFSAVAAKEYSDTSNRLDLPHAFEEQQLLHLHRGANAVQALHETFNSWLDEQQDKHLAHVALHGFSDILGNQQALILADGTPIFPSRFSGQWYGPPKKPRFAFVFLNACQVGAGGAQLGRLAGFPKELIRNGAQGFLAPLWEVHDKIAKDIALDFYRLVFDEFETVAEALRKIRLQHSDKGISPWAYVYYGHPKLKLQRSNSSTTSPQTACDKPLTISQ